jgi:hypothetical protein
LWFLSKKVQKWQIQIMPKLTLYLFDNILIGSIRDIQYIYFIIFTFFRKRPSIVYIVPDPVTPSETNGRAWDKISNSLKLHKIEISNSIVNLVLLFGLLLLSLDPGFNRKKSY